jgi:hypothetical protein
MKLMIHLLIGLKVLLHTHTFDLTQLESYFLKRRPWIATWPHDNVALES